MTHLSSPPPPQPFLTAEWRHLAMLNYEVDPAVLKPLLPAGTELDPWQGKTLVSMVGFRFLQTRVRRLAIPFHQDFDEVNLRFYVRRQAPDGWRRGVVFVRELVPRAAIAWVARTIYQEPYLAVPMWHRIEGEVAAPRAVGYGWRFRGRDHQLRLETSGGFRDLREGEQAEFITEHYWGYTKQRNGATFEYQVEHPRWRVMAAGTTTFECDVADLYGTGFKEFLTGIPESALLAEGSAVTVYPGVKITP
jgi:uncharacterized protein YqjF (DUF2071 family)